MQYKPHYITMCFVALQTTIQWKERRLLDLIPKLSNLEKLILLYLALNLTTC
jgi:hypothetical protein